MKKQSSYTYLLIGICIFLFIVLILMMCKDTEWFKKVGYPRPQGNLSNFKYGLKHKQQKKERKSWNSVLSDKENFKVPVSKTVLI